MTFDEALTRFRFAASAVEQEHPSLRMIVQGARASARRISDRYRVDQDGPRADRELATLLLDLAEAAGQQASFSREFPSEDAGGPPSMETLESVRASNRGSLGIAGVGETRTLIGAELGGLASAGAEQLVRSAAVRSGNRWINKFTNWLMDVFGGPDFDIEFRQPIGTVTVSPFGHGDPAKAAAVIGTAFLVTALAAYALLQICSCSRRCPKGSAA